MEVNKAPEKLYIDCRDKAESTWRCAYTEKALANDIEYTRTDAFIEKTCKYISLHQCEYINFEDFKKYMKGDG